MSHVLSMRVLCAQGAAALLSAGHAYASQGPGTLPGTASPFTQMAMAWVRSSRRLTLPSRANGIFWHFALRKSLARRFPMTSLRASPPPANIFDGCLMVPEITPVSVMTMKAA